MCKSSQSTNLSTRFFEECIQPSLHHLSALRRRFPEPHSKPHSLSKHQFCFWDGFIEKVVFELVLKTEQIQIVKKWNLEKSILSGMMTMGRVQRCKTKDVWMKVKVSKEFLFFSKRLSERGLFHLLGPSAFLNAWGHFLVLTLQSLKISQRANTSFTLNSNGIKKNVPDPQRPHFQKSHLPQTSPPPHLDQLHQKYPWAQGSDEICSALQFWSSCLTPAEFNCWSSNFFFKGDHLTFSEFWFLGFLFSQKRQRQLMEVWVSCPKYHCYLLTPVPRLITQPLIQGLQKTEWFLVC